MVDTEPDYMNIILANQIIENNLHMNTEQKYSNKIKRFYDWFQKIHRELCGSPDNDDLDLVAI